MGPPIMNKKVRRQERKQIAMLNLVTLKTLREQATGRLADVDAALREKGLAPVDLKMQREMVRSSYATTLKKLPAKSLLGPNKLTPRQRMFLTAYISGPVGVRGIATRAAFAAGFSRSDPGVGQYLLKHDGVRKEIAKYLAKWDRQAQDVIDELHRIAFADLREVAEWDGTFASPLPSDEITDDAAASVAEVSVTATPNGPVAKIKQHDKSAALGLLTKFYGLVRDRVEHTGPGGGPIAVEHAVTFYLPRSRRITSDAVVPLSISENGGHSEHG